MDCRSTLPCSSSQITEISRHQKAVISKPTGYFPDFTGWQPLRESPRIWPRIDLLAAPKPQPKQKQYTSQDVDLLLHNVCKRLEIVQRERYMMLQKAKIEGCIKAKSFLELEQLEWYHYSGCAKKYL